MFKAERWRTPGVSPVFGLGYLRGELAGNGARFKAHLERVPAPPACTGRLPEGRRKQATGGAREHMFFTSATRVEKQTVPPLLALGLALRPQISFVCRS